MLGAVFHPYCVININTLYVPRPPPLPHNVTTRYRRAPLSRALLAYWLTVSNTTAHTHTGCENVGVRFSAARSSRITAHM